MVVALALSSGLNASLTKSVRQQGVDAVVALNYDDPSERPNEYIAVEGGGRRRFGAASLAMDTGIFAPLVNK